MSSDSTNLSVSERPRFVRALLVVGLLALGVRVGYVVWGKGGECRIMVPDTGAVVSSPTSCLGGPNGEANDSVYYNAAANHLARGGGFSDPFRPDQPAADHPPLTVVVLAPVSWVGDHLPDWLLDDPTNALLHRLAMAAIGTLVAVGIAVLARRIANARRDTWACANTPPNDRQRTPPFGRRAPQASRGRRPALPR